MTNDPLLLVTITKKGGKFESSTQPDASSEIETEGSDEDCASYARVGNYFFDEC